MQTLCLEASRLQGLDVPLEHIEVNVGMLPEILRRTLRSYTATTALDFLRRGPPTRGSERISYQLKNGNAADVYECLIAALREDPPFSQIGLEDLRERVRNVLSDHRDPNIRSALQQYGALFKDQTPPLDWDDEKRQLTIVDPHFYFFLRNSPL